MEEIRNMRKAKPSTAKQPNIANNFTTWLSNFISWATLGLWAKTLTATQLEIVKYHMKDKRSNFLYCGAEKENYLLNIAHSRFELHKQFTWLDSNDHERWGVEKLLLMLNNGRSANDCPRNWNSFSSMPNTEPLPLSKYLTAQAMINEINKNDGFSKVEGENIFLKLIGWGAFLGILGAVLYTAFGGWAAKFSMSQARALVAGTVAAGAAPYIAIGVAAVVVVVVVLLARRRSTQHKKLGNKHTKGQAKALAQEQLNTVKQLMEGKTAENMKQFNTRLDIYHQFKWINGNITELTGVVQLLEMFGNEDSSNNYRSASECQEKWETLRYNSTHQPLSNFPTAQAMINKLKENDVKAETEANPNTEKTKKLDSGNAMKHGENLSGTFSGSGNDNNNNNNPNPVTHLDWVKYLLEEHSDVRVSEIETHLKETLELNGASIDSDAQKLLDATRGADNRLEDFPKHTFG